MTVSRRELRLASGLVLFAYIAVHFVDHALGLVSLPVAEAGLAISVAVWHSLPGTLLLYGAAAVHVALALITIYERRTLRMPPLQALRIALGLGMPLMVIGHVAATRLAADLQGLAPTYARIVWNLWKFDREGRQLALLAPGWVHGCLGLAFAFGRRRWWPLLRLPAFGAALLLPVLAGLGFLAMAREMAALSVDGAWTGLPATPAQAEAIQRWRDGLLGAYVGLVALVFAARALRDVVQRRRRMLVTIHYPQRSVAVPRGWSVLEASRGHGIDHLSLCGGNGRCSTCRVHVSAGAENLEPPSADEQRTLARIHAGPDVRLACQLRPRADIGVVPLLEPASADAQGSPVERQVALLLVRLADWSADSGAQPSPHDQVYALDRFLAVIGAAVAAAGGQARYDREGASAIFETASHDLALACRQAHGAATAIESGLLALNVRLARDIGLQARFAVVLHAGPVVIGAVGYGAQRTRTAVGATVQAAQALRDAAVADGRRLVVSPAAAACLA